MIKHFLGKYGLMPSTVVISIFCVVVSILITAAVWTVLRQPNMQLAIFTALIIPSLLAPPLFYSYGRLADELQKKSQEANQIGRELIETEKKYKLLFESANDAIFILNTEGNFIDINRTAYKRLGYTKDEMVAMHITQLDSPDFAAKVPERLEQIRKHDNAVFESAHIRKDGSVMPVEVNSKLISLEDQEVFFSVIRDISDRKKLEEELLKTQKLESTGILAGGIAHDFNNILTGIMGNISMAKMSAKANKKVVERLENAEKASLRAQNLTHQLLTFSKGGAPIKQLASIKELLADSVSFALCGSNVKHELFITKNLWALNIDAGQISQVIQNLTKNAEQAMPEGGVITINVQNIKIAKPNLIPLNEGRYVLITIKDEGGGILAKHVPKIFDPYFSTKQEGSGLGLAVSYSIIKNHDGHITAESEYGNGTTFYIYLPASKRYLPAKAEVRKVSYKSGERILILDDDQDVLDVATNMLNMMGYKTEVAKDGAEALVLYDKAQRIGKPFDAVILDLTIPGGMGGKETMQELSNLNPELKALVSSGYANDPILANYEEYGFHGAVTKPYNMGKIGEAFNKLFV